MNNLRYYTLLTCVLILTNLGIQAHVDLDNPKGGEVFAPGDAITIEWHSEIEHVQIGWNLFFPLTVEIPGTLWPWVWR